MASVYDLKPGFQALLRPLVVGLGAFTVLNRARGALAEGAT